MFSYLMQDGYANIAYIYYQLFDFFVEYNPKLKIILHISSGTHEDEIVILNNGKVEYVSMTE